MKLKHLLLIFLASSTLTMAQVTTASMTGSVSDVKNANLVGATVLAKHLPSGTQYGISTNADGRFIIPNMRVGGLYEVLVSYIGFKGENSLALAYNSARNLC